MKYIKTYEYDYYEDKPKYKIGDYVRDTTAPSNKIFTIINTINHDSGAGFIGSKTGYYYWIDSNGESFWVAENNLEPLSELEISAIKYNI